MEGGFLGVSLCASAIVTSCCPALQCCFHLGKDATVNPNDSGLAGARNPFSQQTPQQLLVQLHVFGDCRKLKWEASLIADMACELLPKNDVLDTDMNGSFRGLRGHNKTSEGLKSTSTQQQM